MESQKGPARPQLESRREQRPACFCLHWLASSHLGLSVGGLDGLPKKHRKELARTATKPGHSTFSFRPYEHPVGLYSYFTDEQSESLENWDVALRYPDTPHYHQTQPLCTVSCALSLATQSLPSHSRLAPQRQGPKFLPGPHIKSQTWWRTFIISELGILGSREVLLAG